MAKPKIGASLLLVLVLTSGASPARSETVNCTPVTTLPASIATSGVYCLTGDLGTTMTSGSAINVTDVGNIVRNNLVVGTGGSTSGGQSNVDAVGIFVGGDGPGCSTTT
jgi:hypothetical protein